MILASKEVVEADLVERCCRGVRGDVAADTVIVLVCLDDHGHGVPADDRLDAPLDIGVAWVGGLSFDGNGVDVRGL